MSKEATSDADRQKADEALAHLLRRAEAGDRSVLEELREALDADSNLWRHYGDLGLQAEAALIQLAAGPNLLLAESLQRRAAALKAEVCGPSPSPLERLLGERIAATWLQVSHADALAAQAGAADEARSKALQRRQDAAHRRHLDAVKTLATVRKLLTPPLSPVEVASRLERTGTRPCRREGVAGTIPVQN